MPLPTVRHCMLSNMKEQAVGVGGNSQKEDLVVAKGKLRLFTGLTQQERKDNIAEQGNETLFPFSPLHAPHPVNLNLSPAERGGYWRTHNEWAV